LTAQQPINNVARVALQALAAVLGGTQSLHTNSLDETYALPSEGAVKVALRTQQIIAEESGVANTVDPLAGSYFVEDLTDRMEQAAYEIIEKIDGMGGMVAAVENGWPQREIGRSAYEFQREVESGDRVIVGVNRFEEAGEGSSIPLLKIDRKVEEDQRQRVKAAREGRDEEAYGSAMKALKAACEGDANILEAVIDVVRVDGTIGEISDTFREVWGKYTDPGYL